MNVILCDGNRQEAANIQSVLTKLSKKNGIPLLITCYHGTESLLFNMEDHMQEADILLLEADLEDGSDGVATARRIRDMGYTGEIIFATHNRDKVFSSFDAEPFHYVLKEDADTDRIESILLRVAERVSGRRKEVISLACAGERRHVPIEDIRYFEVDRRIIRVHYGDPDQTFEFYSTIGKLENTLLGKGILRVHRAYLLAVRHVERATASDAFLDTGASVPLGRTYTKKFREELQKVAGSAAD